MSDFIGTSRAPRIDAATSKQLLTFQGVEGVSGIGLGNVDYDDFIYLSNVVQLVVCIGDTYMYELWYRVAHLINGFTVTTPWTKMTTALSFVKMVTADGGEIYYSDGASVYKRTWNGSWSAETLVINSGQIVDLAFESNNLDSVLYVYRYTATDEPHYTYGVVDLYFTFSGVTYVTTWKGHIPSANQNNVRTGTVGKIVYLQNDYTVSNTPYFFEFDAVHSGPMQKVIALDDLDDLQTFTLSGVSKILNGVQYETVLTGVVTRKNGGKMLVYMVGGKEFTTGLNYYIADVEDESAFGNLHAYAGRVWFFGPDRVYWAEGSKYLASGQRAITPVEGISTMQVSLASNMPFGINMLCKKDNFDNIDAGDELDVSFVEGSTAGGIQFVVDSVKKVITDNDVSCQVSAASKWMKMLNDWNSDSYYDYWSQTKSSGNPKDLTKMVRFSSVWSEVIGNLTLDNLNEDGVLYLTDRASSNYSMRARFVRVPGDFNAQFGIVLDFQKETIADAATRLGKESAEVTEGETRKSGIFVIQDEAFNSGAGGVRIYYYSSTNSPAFTQVGADMPFSIYRGGWFQLMANFTNGYLVVSTFNEVTKTWAVIGERALIIPVSGAQWNMGSGRAGIYMKNVTVTGTCYPFVSDSSVIPMVDNSLFPASDTVIVESEQIAYTGKTQNVTVGNLPYRYGKLTASFMTTTGTDFNLGCDKTQAALRIRPVLSGTVWVKAVKLWVQRIGNPLDGIEVSICDPNSTYGVLGGRKISANVSASSISPDGGWITIKFGAGVEMTTAYRIQITKTRYAKTGFVSATDYFKFKHAAGYTYTSQYFNDNTDTWSNLAGCMPFQLITFNDAQPTVATVCVEAGHGLSAANNYYNNQALIVTSGSGEQTAAKIVGYTYAPTDVCVFYTDADITSALDETSVLSVVPALTGLTRAAPATHSGGKIDVSRAGPMAMCENYAYFSEDKDMCLEDVVRKISRHAGVLNFWPRRLLDATIHPNANTEYVQKRSFIFDVNFDGDMPANENAIFHFRMNSSTPSASGNLRFVMNKVECVLYNSDDSVNAKIQGIGSRLDIHSHFRFSLFDQYLSIWDGDKLFHAFVLNDTDAASLGKYFAVDGTSDIDMNVVVPDGFMRIDNFVLDMGKSGLSLIQQVIGNKRFFVQERGDSLVFFRTRNTINAVGSAYNRVVSGTISKVEPPFTRICLEGGEVIEDHDPTDLAQYGNLFYRETINEINTLDDAKDFAEAILSDAGNSTEPIAFTGALWPLLQPQDIVWIKLPSATNQVIADSISYTINVGEKEATFDMSVQGRKI